MPHVDYCHHLDPIMKIKVRAHGVTVPKEMLGDADAVEIRDENGRVVIEPVREAGEARPEWTGDDPILGLGQNPVSCRTLDASENHDQHLYGG